jgi:hypothetical protein
MIYRNFMMELMIAFTIDLLIKWDCTFAINSEICGSDLFALFEFLDCNDIVDDLLTYGNLEMFVIPVV